MTTSSSWAGPPSRGAIFIHRLQEALARSSTWSPSSTTRPSPLSRTTSESSTPRAARRLWGEGDAGTAGAMEIVGPCGGRGDGPADRHRPSRRPGGERTGAEPAGRLRPGAAPLGHRPCCASCWAPTRPYSRPRSWSCSPSKPWPSGAPPSRGGTVSGWKAWSGPSWRPGTWTPPRPSGSSPSGRAKAGPPAAVYRQLQEWLGDWCWWTRPPPTPSTPEVLRRAEEGFAGARYLHSGPPSAGHQPLVRGSQARPDLLPPAAPVLPPPACRADLDGEPPQHPGLPGRHPRASAG